METKLEGRYGLGVVEGHGPPSRSASADTQLTQNGAANYTENVTETFEERDGIKIYKDVTYVSEYPNNTYTVYNVPDNKRVFFYVHGGGLVIGDKFEEQQMVYMNSLVDAGYSVVTVDYALAPQNPFPQSVYEVNDAFLLILSVMRKIMG